MKRIAYCISALLIILMTGGISFSVHCCCNMISGYAFLEPIDSCCDDETIPGCCKNEFHLIKIKDDFIKTSFYRNLTPLITGVVDATRNTLAPVFAAEKNLAANKRPADYPPGGVGRSIVLLNLSLRS